MKKVLCAVFVALSVAFAFWGAGYVKKSGLLKAYPDAVYMSEELAEKRIAYQYLSESEKAVYTALYNGILAKSEYIELPYEISGESYQKIYFTIEKQEPDFFYISSDFYTAEKIRTAQIEYKDDVENSDDKKIELENVRDEIIANLANFHSNFEKLQFLHDYIARNCAYIESGAEYLSTAYGCLADKKANCEGYAKAFKYLCDYADIPCVVVVGTTEDGINHAWNQVELDGKWYNVDVTWDDTDDEFEMNHIYFLGSDAYFLSHYADTSFLPVFECSADEQNFYHKNDLFIKTQSDAERILARELKNISGDIELRFPDEYTYNEFKNVYMENQRVFDILMENNPDIKGAKINCLLKEYESRFVLVLRLSYSK